MLLNGLILKPEKTLPRDVYPEISQMIANMCAIDDIPLLTKLVDAGLPQAVITLIARFKDSSITVVCCGLDGFQNLLNVYQDEMLSNKTKAQL